MPSTRREFLGQSAESFRGIVPTDCPGTDPAPTPSLEEHATMRLTFGAKPGDAQAIATMGYDAWLAQQLNPTTINDGTCNTLANTYAHASLDDNWQQLFDRNSAATYENAIRAFRETRTRTVVRMANSKRQLFEQMVQFWHDHFSLYGLDNYTRALFPKWDGIMRTHAFGNFRAMLEETATNPCMLYFLDNYISTDGGPNENYARELFELHTLGVMNYRVAGGYIDQDVYESSRCFTGWTFETNEASATRGEFKYNHDQHDRFIKLVLGSQIPGDQTSLKDGRDVLDIIAAHPGTAKHIATKLARRFVSDTPSQAIVDSTAQVFLDNTVAADQMKQVMLHLLSSTEFKDTRANKMKRPLDWLISVMRALNIAYVDDDAFFWAYDEIGQPLFLWRTPDGAPDTMNKWATTNGFIKRWNYIMEIANGWYDQYGIDYSVTGIRPGNLRAARNVSLFWSDRVIQRTRSEATDYALAEFMAEGRSWVLPLPDDQLSDKEKYLAALCVMTPEFMRR